MGRFVLGVMALMLIVGCADARGGDPGQPGPPQVVEGDRFRDLDYAFEIRRPSADWEFLLDAEVTRQLDANACVGLLNAKSRAGALVSVEQFGEVKLEDYAQFALDNSQFEEGALLARKETSFAGQSALEVRVQAKSRGVSVFYLMYFVSHEGFVYRLTGWSPQRDFEWNEADLRRIAASFRFLPDRRPRFRSVAVPAQDERGMDWRIQGSRYENASFAIRLTIPPKWRFADMIRVLEQNPHACARVVCVGPRIEQTYTVEPIVDVGQERHEKLVEQDMQRNLGREGPDAVAEVTVGGLQATESVYRDLEHGGLKGTTVHAVLFQKNLCFQIVTVWLGEKEGALEEVRKSYGFLSFLTKQERETLEEELFQSDPDEGVGKTFRLRNGVYCDFEHGFLYRKPRGLWRAFVGDAARAQSSVAVLVLTNPAQGVRIA